MRSLKKTGNHSEVTLGLSIVSSEARPVIVLAPAACYNAAYLRMATWVPFLWASAQTLGQFRLNHSRPAAPSSQQLTCPWATGPCPPRTLQSLSLDPTRPSPSYCSIRITPCITHRLSIKMFMCGSRVSVIWPRKSEVVRWASRLLVRGETASMYVQLNATKTSPRSERSRQFTFAALRVHCPIVLPTSCTVRYVSCLDPSTKMLETTTARTGTSENAAVEETGNDRAWAESPFQGKNSSRQA